MVGGVNSLLANLTVSSINILEKIQILFYVSAVSTGLFFFFQFSHMSGNLPQKLDFPRDAEKNYSSRVFKPFSPSFRAAAHRSSSGLDTRNSYKKVYWGGSSGFLGSSISAKSRPKVLFFCTKWFSQCTIRLERVLGPLFFVRWIFLSKRLSLYHDWLIDRLG